MSILLVEDEPRIADFVKHGLASAGYSVTHAIDGELGLASARSGTHRVVILDAMLPKIDGFELLRLFRQEGNTTPVIMLSAKVDLPYRLLGFENGADDFLPKPFFIEELVARVKVALYRHATEPQIKPQMLVVEGLSLDLVSRKAHWRGVSATLTPREFSLIEYLMRSPGQIQSRKQILAHVWDVNFDPETNVVAVCIQRIKRKLGRKGDPAPLPIESVRGVGYRIRKARLP